MCRLNLFILYNAWPDKQGPETWEQRFLWLGRYVLCQCGEALTAFLRNGHALASRIALA